MLRCSLAISTIRIGWLRVVLRTKLSIIYSKTAYHQIIIVIVQLIQTPEFINNKVVIICTDVGVIRPHSIKTCTYDLLLNKLKNAFNYN